MVWKISPLILFAASAAFLGVGCSSGIADGLTIKPAIPVVQIGESLTINAQPLEDLAGEPEWEIQELHGGGFTQSRGFAVTYVAPPSAGTYHLIARAPRPDGSRMKQIVEIRVLADPQIEPSNTTLGPGGSRTFTARMRGLPRNTVIWAVEEPEGGTISSDGQYVAPTRPGTYHVTATSTLDPNACAIATVRVD